MDRLVSLHQHWITGADTGVERIGWQPHGRASNAPFGQCDGLPERFAPSLRLRRTFAYTGTTLTYRVCVHSIFLVHRSLKDLFIVVAAQAGGFILALIESSVHYSDQKVTNRRHPELHRSHPRHPLAVRDDDRSFVSRCRASGRPCFCRRACDGG
jgi:hypothetical protein